ncbi:SDR family NAD(P)-dependent oxidoreductase [Cohnella fermenti]|uniref:Glucose 1-dehydrogenase n=1 Tax=Cohnella fermenti TaxID=2565925 RepID=A0A4S4BL80_9BACL|nr:glucose 1-dehydrogenase [Cohnella fermenti]THF75511.1 glucose 1-dehydrogenase [Cohnella fermenti]
MRLQNKVAIITGAGSGIGRASALLFAKESAAVVIADADARGGAAVAEQIREAGGKSLFIHGDISELDGASEMARKAIETFGKIDILFNNAGVSGVGVLHEIEPEAWDRVMKVNVRGVYMSCKATVPYMMEKRGGSIINMSSSIAEIGVKERASYTASKGAVLALTKAMQVDYAPYDIRVNALLPGTILTPFVEGYLEKSPDREAAIASIKSRQLSGELGRPEDVAMAALFLASDESRFVMGSPFYVDGGLIHGKNA